MDVTLRTSRLVLRQPHDDDAPRIARFLNNFAVSGKLSRVPYPYRLSDAEWWLGTWRADKPAGETGFAIELPGEGLIGHCGLHPDTQGIVIGYWLGEPFWNRGYATEAAQTLIDFGFRNFGIDFIDGRVRVMNTASRRVLQKCGFQFQGTGMATSLALGGMVAVEWFRLDRKTWSSLRNWGGAR